MTNEKLFELLGDINEEYIGDTQSHSPKQLAPMKSRDKRKTLSAALIAACICLLLLSATALATSSFGTQIIEFFTSRAEPGSDLAESGYDLNVLIEKVPTKTLGEVREAGAFIAQQYEAYPPYASWFPGHWQESFASQEAACTYVGLDRLRPLALGLPEMDTKLNVYGDKDGKIEIINIETLCTEGDIRLQFFSTVYTEHASQRITTGSRTTESVSFTESFYTTNSEKICHIIRSSPMESGYASIDGYMVESGVLYHLHIAYAEKDAQRAEELLYQWVEVL